MRKCTAVSILWVLLAACSPSRDSVLKDVERNYSSAGFLDTETFQVQCDLGPDKERLRFCHEKMLAALVTYKQNYDNVSYARRMHPDFQPFVKSVEASEATRETWRQFYESLATGRTRLVYEKRTGDVVQGVYRLRLKDLIYRVQRIG